MSRTSAARLPVPEAPPRIHATTTQVRAWLRAAGIAPRLLTGNCVLHLITKTESVTIRPCTHAGGCHVIGEFEGGLP